MLRSNEPVSDDSLIVAATPSISRRQILKAGAWAAPVIVLATATPAAAGSLAPPPPPPPPSGPTASGKVIINKYAPTIQTQGNSGQHRIYLNSAQVWYDPSQFSPVEGWKAPGSAMVSWRVVVKNSGGTIVHTFADRTDTLGTYRDSEVKGLITPVLPAGTYTVVSEVISVTFSPNPTNGYTFVATLPSTASSTATIN